MTPDEARQLVGVEGNYSLEELQEACRRRCQDLESRIERAPTPGLKEKYRRNLGQIEVAREILSHNEGAGANTNLPSLRPIEVKARADARKDVPKPAPTPSDNGGGKHQPAKVEPQYLLIGALVLAVIVLGGVTLYYGVLVPVGQARQAEIAKQEPIPMESEADVQAAAQKTQLNAEAAKQAQQGNNFTNSVGMDLVWVAPLNCWVAKYRVTPDQYKMVTGISLDANGELTPEGVSADNQTINVSWNDAVAFAKKLTQREQEAGTLPKNYEYHLPRDSQFDIYEGNSYDQDLLSDPNKPNNYGIGGIDSQWEWCEDWYSASMNSEETRTVDPDSADDGGGNKYKVLRGHSWQAFPHLPDNLVSTFRQFDVPDRPAIAGYWCYGIRVVLEASP